MASNTPTISAVVNRDIAGGPIRVVQEDGLIRARGIQYAVARRFEVPSQPGTWTQPVDCTKPGPVCPQIPSRLDILMGDVLIDRSMDEDCLFLSVTAPAKHAGQALPVMVWFHGGAYITGGGDLEPYHPCALVKRGVIVVNVNYRLGIFGQQQIPGIAPANLGLQDQITALHWVQRNIPYFGGDPKNVTIFGQSAGGDSCYCLLVADGAEDLFQRAILQSAPWGSREKRPNLAGPVGQAAKEALGDRAQTISVEDLLKLEADLAEKFVEMPTSLMAFGSTFGEYPLPQQSEIEARLRHAASKKPILVGWTAQDCLPFVLPVPIVKKISKIPFLGSLVVDVIVWLSTRTEFVSGARKLHSFWLNHGGQSTTYNFEYYPHDSPWKATHCIDLPFLLGDWTYWGTVAMMKGISRTTFDRLGDEVKNMWVAFAKGASLGSGHRRITELFKAGV